MTLNIGQRTSSATGGTISTIAGYTVHTFTTGGNFVPRGSGTIEVLVVGGGGGGDGTWGAGGGGGGAVVYNKFVNVTSGTPYPITVASVGSPTGGISSCTFNNGTITAYGGGAGTSAVGVSSPNASGGGGGGGGGGTGGIGAGITGLGFPGGLSGNITPAYGGGGGGGAAGAGTNGGPNYGGYGGRGVAYSITGISSYYGAGASGNNNPSLFNGGLPGASYGTGGTPGAVIIRYPT